MWEVTQDQQVVISAGLSIKVITLKGQGEGVVSE